MTSWWENIDDAESESFDGEAVSEISDESTTEVGRTVKIKNDFAFLCASFLRHGFEKLKLQCSVC